MGEHSDAHGNYDDEDIDDDDGDQKRLVGWLGSVGQEGGRHAFPLVLGVHSPWWPPAS